MVDSVVSFLLENLTQLLQQEVKLLGGVGDQVRMLQSDLKKINKFLENSEGKREQLEDFLNEIRDAAYKAEDVIDTFVVKMAKHKRRNTVEKFLHGFDHTAMLRSVAIDVESINKGISRIYDNRDKYGIENKEEDIDKRSEMRKMRSEVEEDEVVCFVNEADTVMKLLGKGGKKRNVVSIIGMGGLGKTTLAKKVYNDSSFTKKFDCRAWVNVSQEFQSKDLLLNILECIAPNTEEITDKLEEEVSKCLEGKRYLIVLDDVWEPKVWDGIKKAFPDDDNGSRVLITSRSKEVALHASSSPEPYELPFLNEEDSWELFSKKVFRGEVCPLELEIYGREMAKKCSGLPLSILVLAGLLATRDRTPRTWSNMAAAVNWHLTRVPEKCREILALSYYCLPRYLKPCFLYFGVFPEDFEISARQLIRLWIAEGFVEKENCNKFEIVAQEYLRELIDRSLIQVAQRSTDGGFKLCRIHDLLLDLCISEGSREKFLEAPTKVINSPSPTKPRRLSIHCSFTRYITSLSSDSSQVRSIVCFDDRERLSPKNFKLVYKSFGLLRVLDLGSTVVEKVPTQIEKLILLRYLRMNAPHLRDIPPSISGLPNLQTLDLRESPVSYFEESFWKMQQLRHLFISGYCYFPLDNLTEDIAKMKLQTMWNLQTLSSVGTAMLHFLNETSFPNVTKLGVISYYSWIYDVPKFPNLPHLQTLKMIGRFNLSLRTLDEVPLSLTKITLLETVISPSVFAMLAKFPNLQVLKLLKKSLEGTVMKCDKGGFSQLQVLHMVELEVDSWTMETGVMQSLRHLLIKKCQDLTAIPDQLKQVTTLRSVKAIWCSSNLEGSLRSTLGKHVQCEFQGYKAGGWENFMTRK